MTKGQNKPTLTNNTSNHNQQTIKEPLRKKYGKKQIIVKKRKHSLKQQKQRQLTKLHNIKQLYLLEPGKLINTFPSFQFGNRRRSDTILIHGDQRIKRIPSNTVEGKYILDVGCGDGNLTLQISKSFNIKSIVGIDLSKPLIRYALKCKQVELSNVSFQMQQQKKTVQNVNYLQANFFTLSILEGECDTVLCFDVLQYLVKTFGHSIQEIFIQRVHKCLPVNGSLILSYKLTHSPLKSQQPQQNTQIQFRNKLINRGFEIIQWSFESLSRNMFIVCTKKL